MYRHRFDFAVLASTFDSFITILIQYSEILLEFLIIGIDDVSILDRSEFYSESAKHHAMELILV